MQGGEMGGESSREEVPDSERYEFREKPFKQGDQYMHLHGKQVGFQGRIW